MPLMFSLIKRNILHVKLSKMGSETQMPSQSWQSVSFLLFVFYILSCKYKKVIVSGSLKSLFLGRSKTAFLREILSMVSAPSFPASVWTRISLSHVTCSVKYRLSASPSVSKHCDLILWKDNNVVIGRVRGAVVFQGQSCVRKNMEPHWSKPST